MSAVETAYRVKEALQYEGHSAATGERFHLILAPGVYEAGNEAAAFALADMALNVPELVEQAKGAKQAKKATAKSGAIKVQDEDPPLEVAAAEEPAAQPAEGSE